MGHILTFIVTTLYGCAGTRCSPTLLFWAKLVQLLMAFSDATMLAGFAQCPIETACHEVYGKGVLADSRHPITYSLAWS